MAGFQLSINGRIWVSTEASGRFSDVTSLVREKATATTLEIDVTNDTLGGDLIRGTKKELIVEYSIANAETRHTAVTPEGGRMTIGSDIVP